MKTNLVWLEVGEEAAEGSGPVARVRGRQESGWRWLTRRPAARECLGASPGGVAAATFSLPSPREGEAAISTHWDPGEPPP